MGEAERGRVSKNCFVSWPHRIHIEEWRMDIDRAVCSIHSIMEINSTEGHFILSQHDPQVMTLTAAKTRALENWPRLSSSRTMSLES